MSCLFSVCVSVYLCVCMSVTIVTFLDYSQTGRHRDAIFGMHTHMIPRSSSQAIVCLQEFFSWPAVSVGAFCWPTGPVIQQCGKAQGCDFWHAYLYNTQKRHMLFYVFNISLAGPQDQYEFFRWPSEPARLLSLLIEPAKKKSGGFM